jgi:hypothetical protein
MTVDQQPETSRTDVVRERAVTRLKKKRDFYTHLVVFALGNAMIVAIWAMTDLHGFFWPVYPLLGWGFAVAMNAWDVYRREDFTEAEIQREIEQLENSK